MPDTSHLWLPYCGAAPSPAEWLWHWNLDPGLIIALVALLGAGLVWSPATRRQQIAAGIVTTALFVSPLCALGSALFTFRTLHHLALAVVLAPLLARTIGGLVARGAPSLVGSTVVQVVIFWAWHAPLLYAGALSSDAVFWVMQLSLIGTATAWWMSLRCASTLAATASVLASMVQMGLLGALLVFGGRAFYEPHLLTTAVWGLSPLEDQQIAGLIMWVMGSGVYLAIALALLYRALASTASPQRA